jgi:hypothetical protein
MAITAPFVVISSLANKGFVRLLFTAIIPYKIVGLDIILYIGTLRYEEQKTYGEIIKNAGNFMEKEFRWAFWSPDKLCTQPFPTLCPSEKLGSCCEDMSCQM